MQLDTVTGDPLVAPILLTLEPDMTFDVVDDGGTVWREAVIGWDVQVGFDELEGVLLLEDVTRWTNVGHWGAAIWGVDRWGIGGIEDMATGRKTVVVGQVIDQVAWGNPLWDQSVQSFASAADRAAQFPAPLQGALSWLEDGKSLEAFDGNKWDGSTDDRRPPPCARRTVPDGARHRQQRH